LVAESNARQGRTAIVRRRIMYDLQQI